MRESHWFRRTADSGAKRLLATADGVNRDPIPLSPPSAAASDHHIEEARLAAKAETLTACAALASTYEAKDASAGIVRFQLAQRADEAWARLEHHHHSPLGAGVRESRERSSASAPSGADDVARLRDNGEPSTVPLLESRLRLIEKSLAGATQPLAEYLRTIQAIARGATPAVDVSEPRSLRVVESPVLRAVE